MHFLKWNLICAIFVDDAEAEKMTSEEEEADDEVSTQEEGNNWMWQRQHFRPFPWSIIPYSANARSTKYDGSTIFKSIQSGKCFE